MAAAALEKNSRRPASALRAVDVVVPACGAKAAAVLLMVGQGKEIREKKVGFTKNC